MQRIIDFLNRNPSGFLATVEDGLPRLRPFEFMQEREGRLYFCTGKKKDVYSQLVKTPTIEFSSLSGDIRWVRVRGDVVFDDAPQVRREIFEAHQNLKALYGSPDNPVFAPFFLEHGVAYFGDFSGNPYIKIDF